MRLRCYGCTKSVSSEVPEGTILRAVAICPECIENGWTPEAESPLFFEDPLPDEPKDSPDLPGDEAA